MALPAPARAGLAIAGLTAVAAVLGDLFPGLAPGRDPHPVLHGTIAEATDIAVTNLRVLSAPFLLALLGLHHGPRRRRIGDLVIAVIATLNTVQVGLALGADGPRLIPYVPQLPLEWTALTLSIAAWLELRTGHASRRRIGRYAAATLALTVTAAAVETFATPHSDQQRHVPTAGSVSRSAVSPAWEAGGEVPSARLCAGPPGRCKVTDAPFPQVGGRACQIQDRERQRNRDHAIAQQRDQRCAEDEPELPQPQHLEIRRQAHRSILSHQTDLRVGAFERSCRRLPKTLKTHSAASCGTRRIAFAQFRRPAGRTASRSTDVSLPLARGLGSASGRRPAFRALSTTGSPQGGNQR